MVSSSGACAKLIVVDARHHMLGRLLSIIAKELLNDQKVVVIRCEEICLSAGHVSRHSLELTLSLAPYPLTSCDSASRRVVPPDRRLAKFRATQRWRRRTAVLSASALSQLHGLGLLDAHSRVLCIAAGAGHTVHAFRSAGVREVAGVDLVEFPLLVRRGDPHCLLFSAGAFDLLFSDDPRAICGALFPIRIVAEAERVVCRGGGRPARRSGSSKMGARANAGRGGGAGSGRRAALVPACVSCGRKEIEKKENDSIA
ncbi:uncharacterized protein LOC112892746 [Panicum hallii]|uniref:uncharacterized protein LOC112892746 n=1 Tax=Panicum hallii TaxID=206008 RepID=UPI000DF4E2E1|nr:uncharacterized protein LOC112892746 [Panicum hallii]